MTLITLNQCSEINKNKKFFKNKIFLADTNFIIRLRRLYTTNHDKKITLIQKFFDTSIYDDNV